MFGAQYTQIVDGNAYASNWPFDYSTLEDYEFFAGQVLKGERIQEAIDQFDTPVVMDYMATPFTISQLNLRNGRGLAVCLNDDAALYLQQCESYDNISLIPGDARDEGVQDAINYWQEINHFEGFTNILWFPGGGIKNMDRSSYLITLDSLLKRLSPKKGSLTAHINPLLPELIDCVDHTLDELSLAGNHLEVIRSIPDQLLGYSYRITLNGEYTDSILNYMYQY